MTNESAKVQKHKQQHEKFKMITQETNPVYWAYTHCLTLEPWTVIFINLASIWKIDYAENLNFLFNQFILR